MDNTMQLYVDEERKVKGYPITSPDRVIDEHGNNITTRLNGNVKYDVVGEGMGIPPMDTWQTYDDSELQRHVKNINNELSDARNGQEKLGNTIRDINMRTSEYIFNVNALKKVRRLNYKRIISIGDSIGAGSNAKNNDGFFNQLSTTLKFNQGCVGVTHINFYYVENSGWHKEEDGICKFLMSSNDASKPLKLFDYSWHIPSLKDYTIQIVYSKRPDAGSFVIKQGDDDVVATISCQGNKEDGVITSVHKITKGKNVKIVPSGDGTVYINHAIVDFDPDITEKNRFENWSVGGRKSKDYTNQQLQTMLSYREFDLFIWELFANDYSGKDFDTYKQRTEFAISLAKSKGMDVLIPITCGNSSSDSNTDIYDNFRNVWVKFLYDTAIKYDCCIIDYDKKWGGYKNAKSNNLIADTIHPTYDGHTNMAIDICNIIVGSNPCRYEKSDVWTGDSRKTPFGANAYNNKQYFINETVLDKPYAISYDNNGNINYRRMQPLIRLNTFAALPKFAPAGALASVGKEIYINTTESNGTTTKATWELYNEFRFLKAVYMNNNGVQYYKHLYPNVTVDNIAQRPKFAPASAICFIGRHMYVNTTDWGNDKNIEATWKSVIADESRIELLTSQPTSVTDDYLNRIFRYEQAGKDDQLITYIKTSNNSRKWVKIATEDFNW